MPSGSREAEWDLAVNYNALYSREKAQVTSGEEGGIIKSHRDSERMTVSSAWAVFQLRSWEDTRSKLFRKISKSWKKAENVGLILYRRV